MVSYRCKACIWFDIRNPVTVSGFVDTFGCCRKKWPIVRQDKDGNYLSNWVLVKPDDFCGECMPDKEVTSGLPK